MKNTIFTGAGVAIITPMNPDGSINYDGFAENIEYQIKNGTDAIIVCGTTGEASTMTDEEHIECIRFCVEKTAGRVPVIAGTGSNDTKKTVYLQYRGYGKDMYRACKERIYNSKRLCAWT